MSARQTSEAIARESVANAMARQRGYRDFMDVRPSAVMTAGINHTADMCVRHLAKGRTGLAHAYARIHASLLDSDNRMRARRDAM